MALVREHDALRAAIAPDGEVPSVYACYRFAAKLRAFKPLLDACLDRVTASLHAEMPEMGADALVPRQSPRWWKLYKGRAAVEREFGRLQKRVGATAPAGP